jgi:hypothetical protein
MATFAGASGLSMINIAASITVLNGVNITHPFLSYQGAVIEFSGNGVVNGNLVRGSPRNLVGRDGKLIANGLQLPGECAQADVNQPGWCW